MNALFLYPADGGLFKLEEVNRCFRDLSFSFSEFEKEGDEFALCKGRFDFQGESNLVELKRSLEAIVLGREGKAALKLAFDIQLLYPESIGITNESFSFELCVKDFSSYEEFEKKALEFLN